MAQSLPNEKIEFDWSNISPAGLIGSPDSLRSVRYEFCIPLTQAALAEVQAIDPNLQCYQTSPGRIGCSCEQYLCIGDTHHPRWRDILYAIAELDYVQRIVESFGE
ncbi:hypothetical protein [Egbenema bharatensis]|uniref:hypothetical protein n=1 Tax=Egbenema bharatensis TaxID=3463334 RepID=UPI003A88C703